jgi:hypothetical protein
MSMSLPFGSLSTKNVVVDLYFNKEGEPISQEGWEAVMFTDYQIVRKTSIWDALFTPIIEVSTVWLGMKHNWSGEGPPIIFETMVFGSKEFEDYQWRYATEAEAIAGHEEVVKLVRLDEGLDNLAN